MAEVSDSDERVGWELIWRDGPSVYKKYNTFSAPNDTVVEWADTLPQGGFVLDVGCGIGRHVLYLGDRGFRMAGVDISPTGIKTSQEVCAARQIPFEGRVSDMHMLSWADATFDAALSTSTISHHLVANIQKTVDEVWRILKPGGLFLADFQHKGTLAYQQLRDQVAAGELTEVEPDTFVDERPDRDPMDDDFLPHHYSDEAEVRDLLRAFEIVKLWADVQEVVKENVTGKNGKWVVWAKKPLAG